jgi:hypothetical protein
MQEKYKIIHNKIRKFTTNIQYNQTKNTFYKRTDNITNATFTEAEIKLLGKGLKYNLHYEHKDRIKTLATEADKAISKMHVRDQIYMRQIVTNNIQNLISKQKAQTGSRQTNKYKLESQERNLIKA